MPASGARIRHLLPKVCYWLLTAVSKWATEQGIDGSEGAVRIEYGQPIRSLITVADIVGYAASSSPDPPSNSSTSEPAGRRWYRGGASLANARVTVFLKTPHTRVFGHGFAARTGHQKDLRVHGGHIGEPSVGSLEMLDSFAATRRANCTGFSTDPSDRIDTPEVMLGAHGDVS